MDIQFTQKHDTVPRVKNFLLYLCLYIALWDWQNSLELIAVFRNLVSLYVEHIWVRDVFLNDGLWTRKNNPCLSDTVVELAALGYEAKEKLVRMLWNVHFCQYFVYFFIEGAYLL